MLRAARTAAVGRNLVLSTVLYLAGTVSPAYAANLSPASIRLDRAQTGVTTAVTVTFTPKLTAGADRILVRMPNGFALSSSPSLSTAGLDPGIEPLPGIPIAATSGQQFLVTNFSPLSPGVRYGFRINAVTNPAAGLYTGSVATASGASVLERTSIGMYVASSDQVSVTGTAPSGCTQRADLTGDCYVNIFDLSILLSNYNKATSRGDINKDGRVNVFDLSILLSNYGKRG